ncbi:UNVERIFIED_ORG: hypothetical protein M2414_002853 [Rahnella aquatilis]
MTYVNTTFYINAHYQKISALPSWMYNNDLSYLLNKKQGML